MTPGAARPLRRPGFFAHLWLLWGLRLRLALNRGPKARAAVAVAAFLASSAPSVVLAAAFYRLMRLDAVAESALWPDFIVRLLFFVTTCVWVTWPVMSAGVDDHSELSRYAAFPISGARLLAASTVASLFEPRAIVFTGPLVGAVVGYVTIRPPEHPVLVTAALLTYVLLNAALSRVGLYVVLSVLRQPRSAELLGTGFLVSLFLASLIPPVDTSWLFRLQEAGAAAVPDQLVADASLALGRFPTGFPGVVLRQSWHGRWLPAALRLLGLGLMTATAMGVAYALLLRFHRSAGRAGPQGGQARAANPFAKTTTAFRTLVVREAVDLWNNPRARLLVSVPFVLGILLKLISARALFAFFLGETADAWVLGGLCVYGAIVLGSTFSQNAFAYDGHGFTVFLAAPMEVGDVLKAKNLVHAAAGFGLAVAVAVFYVLYFGHGSALDVACVLTAVAGLVPVLLSAGNFLSLYFPVKFHANLKRRDKLPFLASMLGVAAASVGTAPLAWALEAAGRGGTTFGTWLFLALAATCAWLVYRLLLPPALRLLVARREVVLRAVTRE